MTPALSPADFFPQRGEREFIVGSTGGGKSKFVRWLLPNLDMSPLVIYDTKEEQSFATLERSQIVELWADVPKACNNKKLDYVIYRPSLNLLANHEAMDNLLWQHYHDLRGTGLVIDELGDFTNTARPGIGLASILARGRSRGITAILCTQRPAWIPAICITEAQKYVVFRLKPKDQDKIGNDAGIPAKLENGKLIEFGKLEDPPEFGFWFYSSRLKEPKLFSPVRLDDKTNTGYVDDTSAAELRRAFTWL